MSPQECLAMRTPDLGVAILRRLAGLDETWRNEHNFVQWTVDSNGGWFATQGPLVTDVYVPGADHRQQRDRLKARLRQAWRWLDNQGYVAPDHGQGPNWKVLTPEGAEI